MEYFFSHGGNNDPDFRYKVKVSKFTTEMYEWCEGFDNEGAHFRRWYVKWAQRRGAGYDVVQFEWETAALMFKLTWGGE